MGFVTISFWNPLHGERLSSSVECNCGYFVEVEQLWLLCGSFAQLQEESEK